MALHPRTVAKVLAVLAAATAGALAVKEAKRRADDRRALDAPASSSNGADGQ